MPLELEMVFRLLLATSIGLIIGYERERARRPAGLRTITLICLGSSLFTIVSIYGFGVEAEPARVASGIVTGIGFLGAGAIMQRRRGIVEGLTTAATIWAAAAVGLMAGAGLYLLSAVAAAVILIVLSLPRPTS